MSNGTMATRTMRPKKFSNKLSLPVYTEAQLLELTHPDNITQRAVPLVETGVEKEEEAEHDLQAALCAAQAAVTTGSAMQSYIPTPDASSVIDPAEFSKMYKTKYKESSTLIRFSSTVEDLTGCPYVMDEEDDDYLKEHGDLSLSEDEFEKLMWEFERITNQQLPHLYLDVTHIPEYEDFLLLVPPHSIIHSWASAPQLYTHWKDRRIKRGGKSIIPVLAFEDLLKHEIDPYVCFRRRETKSVRKTRRSDQQSLGHLRKLRTEMEQARNLLEMVLRREKLRRETLILKHSIFDKTRVALECQRTLNIKDDDELNQILSPKKKRKHAENGSGTTIKIPLSRLRRDAADKLEKSPLQIQIEKQLARKREQDAGYEDVTENPYQPLPKLLPSMFFQTLSALPSNDELVKLNHTTSASRSTTGPRFRRRVGRGGRIFMDRMGPRHKRTVPPSSLAIGGKTNKAPSYWYMDSESDGSDYECDTMDNALLQHRMTSLDEQALRSLITIPFTQPFTMNTGSLHGKNGQQQKQRVALQNSNTNAATGAGMQSTTSTSSSSSVSSLSSSTTTPLKQQNSNSNQLIPQLPVTTAQAVPMESYTLNGVDANENRPTMPSPHSNGTPSLPRPTAHIS